MSFLCAPSPRWFTLQAHRPFLADLARTLHDTFSADGPESLGDAVVLTPTRRGARSLGEAFVAAAGGGALLLPQILALGDLDEGEPPFEPGDLSLDLPPAISPTQRRFELAALVSRHSSLFEIPPGAVGALDLGDALGAFLDSLQIEELDPRAKLPNLVGGDLAAHWAKSADVLSLATEAWPERLRELGLVDVTERRTRLLRALAGQWARTPPVRPLIAAGSTGTAPATADLLAVIARAPRGAVVLPGLDLDLAETAWSQIGEAHPQGAMKRLIERVGVKRGSVRLWPCPESEPGRWRGHARRRIINEALRPPEATRDWLQIIEDLRAEAGPAVDPVEEGLKGLSLVAARNEEDAAALAALVLREALETEGRTAALITPDAAMARRVGARLARWGIQADSSAGLPLANAPQGTLLVLSARIAANPMDPIAILAALKHPLVRLGLDERQRSLGRRALERYALRGPRPRDWKGVNVRLDAALARRASEAETPPSLETLELFKVASGLGEALQQAIEPLAALFSEGARADLSTTARTLVGVVETLARDELGSLGELWAGPSGEAAASFLAGLIEDAAAMHDLTLANVIEILGNLLAGQPFRSKEPGHPRLRILGTLEARLVSADLLVLAGLEEGVWPKTPPIDPFLSRPMRADIGLPSPERRIGLSAHDFAQAACAPQVVLITTDRREGQPAVKSRWIWRLETLVRGAGHSLPRRDELESWARAMDAPLTPPPATLRPAERPAPRPPLHARPRRLPVTRIETWVRDPYAVYAREILKLRTLDRPDAAMEAHRRGTAIHRAFQLFAAAHESGPPPEPHALFARLVIEALQEAGFSPAALAREETLARRLGRWAAGFEVERRRGLEDLQVESEGAHTFSVGGLPFTVTAKADRIELAGELAHVIDFKTGQAPTPEQVKAGFYPQLTLTAAILMRGGFEGLGRPQPGELLYVRAIGRRVEGETKSGVKKGSTSLELAEEAFSGLIRRIARFDDPSTPYRPWAAPQFLSQRAGEYDHLSRLFEWHVIGDEGETEVAEE